MVVGTDDIVHITVLTVVRFTNGVVVGVVAITAVASHFFNVLSLFCTIALVTGDGVCVAAICMIVSDIADLL